MKVVVAAIIVDGSPLDRLPIKSVTLRASRGRDPGLGREIDTSM
jgi:hypothetical protein